AVRLHHIVRITLIDGIVAGDDQETAFVFLRRELHCRAALNFIRRGELQHWDKAWVTLRRLEPSFVVAGAVILTLNEQIVVGGDRRDDRYLGTSSQIS